MEPPRARSEEAIDFLFTHSPNISVPDIFCVEVASTLVREANVDKASVADARGSLARFKALCEGGGLEIVRSNPVSSDGAAAPPIFSTDA